jgi:hypothetical protein
LIPVGTLNHGAYRGKIRTFLATGATGAIFIGSPVLPGGDSGAYNGNRYATCAGGVVTSNGVIGVCVGVIPTDRSATTHRVTSTSRLILVDVDPYTIYEVQDNQATDAAAVLSTEIGMTADLSSDAGSTVTGYSSLALDGTTATATYTPGTTDTDVEIIDIIQDPRNDIGAYCRYHVRLLNHVFGPTYHRFAGN